MAERETDNCSNIIDSLLNGMDGILATKTVVGEATHIGDTIILPLVDVSFGVGAGASLKDGTKGDKRGGGGGGLTGKLTPSAVLVIKDGNAKLVNIKNQDSVTKILDMVPDVIDKISGMIRPKDKSLSDEEVIDAAFGKDIKASGKADDKATAETGYFEA